VSPAEKEKREKKKKFVEGGGRGGAGAVVCFRNAFFIRSMHFRGLKENHLKNDKENVSYANKPNENLKKEGRMGVKRGQGKMFLKLLVDVHLFELAHVRQPKKKSQGKSHNKKGTTKTQSRPPAGGVGGEERNAGDYRGACCIQVTPRKRILEAGLRLIRGGKRKPYGSENYLSIAFCKNWSGK